MGLLGTIGNLKNSSDLGHSMSGTDESTRVSQNTSIFTQIGESILKPRNQRKPVTEKENYLTRKLISQSILFVLGIAGFTGVVFMFFFGYPEIYMYPGSLRGGPNLFIFGPSTPTLLLLFFLAGFALVFVLDFLAYGLTSRWILIRCSSNRKERASPARKTGFLARYGLTFSPVAFASVFIIFWAYFFERFNYAKVIFPIVDLTVPVVVFLAVLGGFFAWKCFLEYQFFLGYFDVLPKRAILPILVKLGIIAGLIGIFAGVANQIASQFA